MSTAGTFVSFDHQSSQRNDGRNMAHSTFICLRNQTYQKRFCNYFDFISTRFLMHYMKCWTKSVLCAFFVVFLVSFGSGVSFQNWFEMRQKERRKRKAEKLMARQVYWAARFNEYLVNPPIENHMKSTCCVPIVSEAAISKDGKQTFQAVSFFAAKSLHVAFCVIISISFRLGFFFFLSPQNKWIFLAVWIF